MMNLTMCSWNVRGLGRAEKRWGIRDIMKRWNVDIFNVQETKAAILKRGWLLDMWGRRHFDFIHKQAVNSVGGILITWNSNVVAVWDKKVGEFSVSILYRSREDDYRWAFSSVYRPANHSDFEAVSSELGQVVREWVVPWCVGRDFNAV